MKRKEMYDCYVECWKIFLAWCNRAMEDGKNFNYGLMIKEIDSVYNKYKETELKKFCSGLLDVLSRQMDKMLTNEMKIE